MLSSNLPEKSFYSHVDVNYTNGYSKKPAQPTSSYICLPEINQGLPKLATANDLREVVRFFRANDSNITLLDFLSLEPHRVFDKRKLSAYIYWGIICLENDYIRLTEFGSELAKKIELERYFYRQILTSNTPYISAIKWINKQNSKIINYQKVISFWQQDFPENIIADIDQQEKDLEAIAASFFSLCHAAELGTMIIGKRGQPTRLNVNFCEIKEFIEEGLQIDSNESNHNANNLLSKQKKEEKIKIYLSCNQRDEISELLDLLGLMDFNYNIVNEFKTENGFSTFFGLSTLKQCELGLFILNTSHCIRKNGKNTHLRDETLLEINTALAVFSQKVILCWNSLDSPPPEIENTRLSVIKTERLNWATNINILKTLKEFC